MAIWAILIIFILLMMNNVNDDDLFIVIHILNTMLVQSIGIALKNNDINKIRNMYIKEIDLILKGIERGNV